jgi:hypothetical protein
MAKAKRGAATAAAQDQIPRWELQADYVESCNCDFGCPCNFSGYPTDGYCEAVVGYHVRKGRFGKTRLDGLDVIYAVAWPKAIGPFELFAGTLASVEEPVFAPIEMIIDGRKSAFRVPGHVEVALAPFTNPVSGEVQDVRLSLPKGFIFRSAQAARTLVMKLFGAGRLSFDHSGRNAFFARLEFAGP